MHEGQDSNLKTPTSLISPEAQAFISASIAGAVKEVFAGLAPVLKEMAQAGAMTPEKLAALKAPYVDPKLVARELRESQNTKEQDAELRRAVAARQAACSHLDANQRPSISLCHNHPDRSPRGICVRCQSWITPREWRIAANEEEAAQHKTHAGKAYLADEHPAYYRVRELEAMQ